MSSVLFRVPIVKDILRVSGAVHASRADIGAVLSKGESVAMHPDGVAAMSGLDPERVRTGGGIVRRMGWINVAIAQARADEKPLYIVPMWAHHEHEYYQTYLFWPQFQRYVLKKLLLPPFVVSWGNPWTLGIFPKRLSHPAIITICEPIPVLPDSDPHEIWMSVYQTSLMAAKATDLDDDDDEDDDDDDDAKK